MQEFEGRTAVVTGGGSGIGRGIALGLADAGMKVVVADLDGAAAEKVAGEIGSSALALTVDVRDEDALARAAARVESEAGGASLLCANAGVLCEVGPLAERTAADWEFVFSVNVHGVVRTVQAFLPQLRAKAPEAHIVNTASLGGLVTVEGFPIGIYTASKYACVGYSESLRNELAAEGIGVSVLCPGVVQSNLMNSSAAVRPAHLGTQPLAPEGSTDTSMIPNAMAAEEVGPIVVRAVRANRLHILTHPETRPMVEARFAEVLDDYSFAGEH
jgi:NAD(P)-dependent dehydrogenase (short-subunit alcohol dehydrogenase family)